MSASREKKKRQDLREDGLLEEEGKKKKRSLSDKAKSRIYAVIAIVLIIAFVLVVFVNSGFVESHFTAVTVADHKITPAEYDYFYMDTYYTYYSYYGDYAAYLFDFESLTLSSIQQTYVLYDQAVAAGFTLTEDEEADIQSTIESLESTATSYGYKNADTYLEAYFGKGCDTESYEQYLTMQQLASSYSTEKSESFTYTDDEIAAYYEENVNDFDRVDYRYFYVDGSAEDGEDETTAMTEAETDAQEMATASAGSEDTFISLAYANADEDSKETYEDDDATLSTYISYSSLQSSYGDDIADWLFDSARLEGETTYLANSSGTGYYVLYFVARNTLDYQTVNVRHILISVDDTTDEDAMSEAKTEAESILEEYEAGEQTEDAFATLAETYSEDTSSASDGGLIEGIYIGQTVTNFNDWCFDESRQVGDVEIVESDYGYHLIYFVGYGDVYRGIAVEDTMRSNDYEDWYLEVSEDYEPVTSSFAMRFVNTISSSSST